MNQSEENTALFYIVLNVYIPTNSQFWKTCTILEHYVSTSHAASFFQMNDTDATNMQIWMLTRGLGM